MQKYYVRGSFRAALTAMILLGAVPALAQAPVIEGEASGPLVTDPAVIGRCLCAGGRLSAEKGTLDALGQRYATAKSRAEATSAAVARARTEIRPGDSEQLDAYRRLLIESQMAAEALYGSAAPAYSAGVTRYNQSVAAYNQACAGIRVDKKLQTHVAETLVCPGS